MTVSHDSIAVEYGMPNAKKYSSQLLDKIKTCFVFYQVLKLNCLIQVTILIFILLKIKYNLQYIHYLSPVLFRLPMF